MRRKPSSLFSIFPSITRRDLHNNLQTLSISFNFHTCNVLSYFHFFTYSLFLDSELIHNNEMPWVCCAWEKIYLSRFWTQIIMIMSESIFSFSVSNLIGSLFNCMWRVSKSQNNSRSKTSWLICSSPLESLSEINECVIIFTRYFYCAWNTIIFFIRSRYFQHVSSEEQIPSSLHVRCF